MSALDRLFANQRARTRDSSTSPDEPAGFLLPAAWRGRAAQLGLFELDPWWDAGTDTMIDPLEDVEVAAAVRSFLAAVLSARVGDVPAWFTDTGEAAVLSPDYRAPRYEPVGIYRDGECDQYGISEQPPVEGATLYVRETDR